MEAVESSATDVVKNCDADKCCDISSGICGKPMGLALLLPLLLFISGTLALIGKATTEGLVEDGNVHGVTRSIPVFFSSMACTVLFTFGMMRRCQSVWQQAKMISKKWKLRQQKFKKKHKQSEGFATLFRTTRDEHDETREPCVVYWFTAAICV